MSLIQKNLQLRPIHEDDKLSKLSLGKESLTPLNTSKHL